MSKRAEHIVSAIINDLSQRKGLGDEWEQLDGVDQYDIGREWVRLVDEELE